MAGSVSPRFAAIARRAAAMPQDNDEDDDDMMGMGQPTMPQPEQAREAPFIAEKAPVPAKKKTAAAAPPSSPFGQPKKPQTFPGAKPGTNRGYV